MTHVSGLPVTSTWLGAVRIFMRFSCAIRWCKSSYVKECLEGAFTQGLGTPSTYCTLSKVVTGMKAAERTWLEAVFKNPFSPGSRQGIENTIKEDFRTRSTLCMRGATSS
jgi:hypothetical protein